MDVESTVAVLGLGAMGSRLAQRLLDAGVAVHIWNRSAEACIPLSAAGARRFATPREAVMEAQIVISMLRDDAASRAVWMDSTTGAAQGLDSGAIAIESSTCSPDWVGELGSMVQARGAAFLDAPVLGSRPQAEAGQLIYLVGGDPEVLARATPILDLVSAQRLHVGGIGDGARVKLAANALFATQVAALAEWRRTLAGQGLDADAALQALTQTPVLSPAAIAATTLMRSGQHAPLFPIALLRKDLRYALHPQREALPLTAAVSGMYEQAARQGLDDLNLTAIACLAAPHAVS
ncbi:NAD(P)-dependent oxidoreductase [Algiphilus sp.]|uniref:NAD(P)-dependent oxidoreductase n=1 Tax=Algiphilus sp. TaxID=1872431 RepID=UPI003B5230D7